MPSFLLRIPMLATNGRSLARATGTVVLATGLVGLLSVASHNPATGDNRLGPLGERIAEVVVGGLGLVGIAWLAAFAVFGSLLALGFVGWPRVKRLAAAAALSLVACGLAHLHLPALGAAAQPFGPGGLAGAALGEGLREAVGPAGAVAILLVTAGALVLLSMNTPASRGPAVPRSSPTGARPDDAASTLDLCTSVPEHALPDPALFRATPASRVTGRRNGRVAERLDACLGDRDVAAQLVDVVEGPVVTTALFEPAPGTPASRLARLGDEMARMLETPPPRIRQPEGGSGTVGLEIPNRDRRIVRFGNMLETLRRETRSGALPVAMGVDTTGLPVVEDLARMPSLIAAGAPGSGKSVFVGTLIASLVCVRQARELRLVVFDSRRELSGFERLPHLACPIVADLRSHAGPVLRALRRERETRDAKGVGSPRIVVVVEELADLVGALGDETPRSLARLAEGAEQTGVHLVVATQRPDAAVLTPDLRDAFGCQIAFRLETQDESLAVLGCAGAETLLGKGDFLCRLGGGVRRLHAPFLEHGEIDALVRSLGPISPRPCVPSPAEAGRS